jgi:hypothetical protein
MNLKPSIITFLFLVFSHTNAQAEPAVVAFAGPKAGIQFFKPTDLTLGAGIHLGMEGGYHFQGIGNAIFNFNTTSFDADTQMNHYLFGFSREVIWGLVASVSIGLQSIFDRELESGVTRISSPTGSSFAYGIGLSYRTDPVLIFRKELNLQLVPEITYIKGSTVNWYGASLGLRFNWMKAE